MVTLQQIKRLFKLKKTKATVAVDRLVRHSETLELNLPSLPMEQAKASLEAVCAADEAEHVVPKANQGETS